MRSMQWLALTLTTGFLLLLCACGGPSSIALIQPPAALKYANSSSTYALGSPITLNHPTSTGGAVASYSVSPALPAGLGLSTTTGIISGTPTAVSPATTYTITAMNSAGSTTASLVIQVNGTLPAGLAYSTNPAVYTTATAIAPNSPANSGGALTSYSVTPPLSAGLLFNTSTGVVSGTPISVSATTIYTVTASNSDGSTSAALTITVNVGAPSGLAYIPGDAVYAMDVPIPENVPVSTGGAVALFTASPPLPTGLSINASPSPVSPIAGAISGTPMVASLATLYTITATNSAGSATANLTITVNAGELSPAGLAYSVPAPVYIPGMPITTNKPSYNAGGGVPTSYAVSPIYSGGPGFPAGLTIDPTTGYITGTPTAVSSATAPPSVSNYTVTASNSAGSTTAILTITMYNSPQWVPNMGQSITPLAPAGSGFEFLDTGMVITDPLDPEVPPVEWMAGFAANSAVSPDGTTLAVLTSGYNRVFQGVFPLHDPLFSNEYVFIYNIQTGTPVFQQAVTIPNSYHGIVWDPIVANHAFYVSGGMGDAAFGTIPVAFLYRYPDGTPGAANNGDNIHIITQDQTTHVWSKTAELDLGQFLAGPPGQPPLQTVWGGHPSGNGLPVPNDSYASVNAAVYVAPCAAGVAISNDGTLLVAANYYNDSITVFGGGLSAWQQQFLPAQHDTGSLQGTGTMQGTELDLRPGNGLPGGEYPFWVVMTNNGPPATPYTAYVSSIRDREIDVVNLENCTPGTPPACTIAPAVKARIPVKGQPNKMTLNQAQTLLYVAEDQSDAVDVINLQTKTVVESIPVIAPPSVLQSFALTQYTGANTNSVTLAEPGEDYLYVTNGNLNNIAVVPLNGSNSGDNVAGLIPTGWYPNSVSLSNVSGSTWAYVVNAKSPTGSNPNWCYNYGPQGYPGCAPANGYNPQLTKAGLQSFPLAGAMAQLSTLTGDVTTNNRFADTSTTGSVMAAVHAGVQHVIYILKENRTYDQILGDLSRGNGDPALALFGGAITPNQHNLAQQFVTLDNFRASSEVSNDGWPWSTSARAPDVIEHQYPVFYAQRGLSLDSEGLNRSVNVALPTVAQRQASDPLFPGGALSPNVPNGENLLPGQTDTAAPDGPEDELNTGYLWDNALRAGLTVRDYGFFIDETCYSVAACQIPLAQDPYSTNTIVAPSSNVALMPFTDVYFRGFDPSFPDYYRYTEWERDFDANYAQGGLANLTLVRFMHDHTGNFATAIDLVDTPDRDVADNDYAVGLLVQKIANSPVYKNNTLIFIVEDDAQDGGDHVDSHRTTAYVAGAYVKNALVSTAYNTIDFVRTMEEVLGLPPMNLNDALGTPMTDIFNTTPNLNWTFSAVPASILYCTNLPLPQPGQPCTNPTPDAKYWARVTRGLDFSDADRVDGEVFNRILWKGLMGDKPYPAAPTGIDLRQNREKLLADDRQSLKQQAARTPKPATD